MEASRGKGGGHRNTGRRGCKAYSREILPMTFSLLLHNYQKVRRVRALEKRGGKDT